MLVRRSVLVKSSLQPPPMTWLGEGQATLTVVPVETVVRTVVTPRHAASVALPQRAQEVRLPGWVLKSQVQPSSPQGWVLMSEVLVKSSLQPPLRTFWPAGHLRNETLLGPIWVKVTIWGRKALQTRKKKGSIEIGTGVVPLVLSRVWVAKLAFRW